LIKRAIDELAPDMESFDMFIVDSGDHLQQRGSHFERRQDQLEGANFWDLKDLAETYEIPGWVTLQAKPEFETKTATTRAAAGAYDKSRICDVLLSINEPAAGKPGGGPSVTSDIEDESIPTKSGNKDQQKTALQLYVAKCRDDESRYFIPIETDLSRMLVKEIEELESEDATEASDET
jgi:hypothetical protein